MDLTVGNILEGKVTRITSFGAFVELDKGISGLIHISEITDTFVKDINDFLQVADTVKVKIITNDQAGKIGLSLKQAQPPKKAAPPPVITKPQEIINDSFEDKLAKFLKDSEAKQNAVKKRFDHKKFR